MLQFLWELRNTLKKLVTSRSPSKNYFLRSIFFILLLAISFIQPGCLKMVKPEEQQAMTRSSPANSLAANPVPVNSNNNNARTPLPPPQMHPVTPPIDYEEYSLDSVFPGGSDIFDPFTYGRPGSPYGPGRIFQPGIGSAGCGPIDMPMSPQFADPGDSQAVLIILGNAVSCTADIFHEKDGAAITFALVAPIFTNSPWTIVVPATTSQVTISNGTVRLRITFRITTQTTFITKIEFV